jgi:DNA invertase Pin-like site-specific DNA recombinase
MMNPQPEDVALFKRTSTNRQETENQDAILAEHVAKHGYHVVKVIELPGVSGSKEHPRHLAALEEILADIRAGAYTKVIVRDASRLDRRSRNHAELFRLRVWEAGGSIESAREAHYGQDSFVGDVMTSAPQRASSEFAEKLSADVKDANAKIDAKQGFRGGRPPFGYRSVCGICKRPRCYDPAHRRNKYLEPDPVTAPVVLEMFERAARGEGIPLIREWLASIGYSKNLSSITGTLRRPIYWSARHRIENYKGEQVTHTATAPIVPKPVFDAANEMLDARSPLGSHPRSGVQDFSAALYDEAGHVLYRAFNGSGAGRTRTYRCAVCKVNFSAEVTDELVDYKLRTDPVAEVRMAYMAGSNYAAQREALQDELDNLPRKRLDRASEQAERERLWSELDAIPEHEKPARQIPVKTGRTRGQAYQAMTQLEKISYMRSGKFRVIVTGSRRDVHVEQRFKQRNGHLLSR